MLQQKSIIIHGRITLSTYKYKENKLNKLSID